MTIKTMTAIGEVSFMDKNKNTEQIMSNDFVSFPLNIQEALVNTFSFPLTQSIIELGNLWTTQQKNGQPLTVVTGRI